jgi:hypothetical protein
MNYSQNQQTVNESKNLPPIISDKKVFSEMTTPERRILYGLINKSLAGVDKKLCRSQDLYKAMLLYPETRLNQAFLSNERADENKWHIYVSVLEHCLFEHLMTSLENFQNKHKDLTVEMDRAEARIISMQKDIEKYSPKPNAR